MLNNSHNSLLKSFLVRRLPFDWRNPFLYSIAIGIHCIMVSYQLIIAACVISFAFGCYFLGIAMSKSIRGSLFSIDQSIGVKIDQKLILDQLAEFLEFHSTAKQLILASNQLNLHFILYECFSLQ